MRSIFAARNRVAPGVVFLAIPLPFEQDPSASRALGGATGSLRADAVADPRGRSANRAPSVVRREGDEREDSTSQPRPLPRAQEPATSYARCLRAEASPATLHAIALAPHARRDISLASTRRLDLRRSTPLATGQRAHPPQSTSLEATQAQVLRPRALLAPGRRLTPPQSLSDAGAGASRKLRPERAPTASWCWLARSPARRIPDRAR